MSEQEIVKIFQCGIFSTSSLFSYNRRNSGEEPPESFQRIQGVVMFPHIQRAIFFRALLIIFFLTMASALQATPSFTPSPSQYHAYIDSNLVIRLELTSKKEIFIEMINLADTRRCLVIDKIFARSDKGDFLKFDSFLYDGSVSKTDGGSRACVAPRTRRIWEIGYNFDSPAMVKRVFVLMGENMYRLEPLSAAEHQEFVANCDKVNLGVSSEYLKVFNLKVLFGKNIYGSMVRSRLIGATRTVEGQRGPVTLLSTFPRQTEQAFRKKKGGEVNMKIKLNEKGEVTEVTPEDQLEYGLTERAVYEVRNWWDFAPAYEDGKPVPSEHTVKVVYRVEAEDEDE